MLHLFFLSYFFIIPSVSIANFHIISYNKYTSHWKVGDLLSNPSATFVQNLLEKAFFKQASDIHFYPATEKKGVQVYFRMLGQRHYFSTLNSQTYKMLLTYFKFISNMDIAEINKPQDGAVTFASKQNQQYALRLSTLPNQQTESLMIRILPQEKSPQLEQLCIFPSQIISMKHWLRNRAGILLMTGPTGSGKTTAMYALLENLLRETSQQIITLEDPIERQLNNVIQVEVNERAGVTYQTGLKAALRHDPDILLIGEIRDKETAVFAFQAALTGHLVLSTLHAKDAPGTIDRLVDLGIPREDIAQTLIAVAAIQLLPLQHAGYGRRAAILELLEGKNLQNVIQTGRESISSGFQTFHRLREKAYMYGFISKEIYEKYS